MPQSDPSAIQPLSVKYERDKAIIRLTHEVTNDKIFSLCDEIDLAIDYYHFRYVDIHIDSPGGHGTALEYFMNRLQVWRQVDDFVLGTLALTSAASAAAMILSLGSIGHRRASPSARLLYHNTRIITQQTTVWTQEKLEMQRSAIEETDQRLTQQLARYIMDHKIGTDGVTVRTPKPTLRGGGLEFEDVQVRNEDALAAVYADLAAYDVFITPEIAVAMHLIDRTGS
jgi:ATP-dependent protease ClpP protease subunit